MYKTWSNWLKVRVRIRYRVRDPGLLPANLNKSKFYFQKKSFLNQHKEHMQNTSPLLFFNLITPTKFVVNQSSCNNQSVRYSKPIIYHLLQTSRFSFHFLTVSWKTWNLSVFLEKWLSIKKASKCLFSSTKKWLQGSGLGEYNLCIIMGWPLPLELAFGASDTCSRHVEHIVAKWSVVLDEWHKVFKTLCHLWPW